MKKSIHRNLWILFLSALLINLWTEVIHGSYSQTVSDKNNNCE